MAGPCSESAEQQPGKSGNKVTSVEAELKDVIDKRDSK